MYTIARIQRCFSLCSFLLIYCVRESDTFFTQNNLQIETCIRHEYIQSIMKNNDVELFGMGTVLCWNVTLGIYWDICKCF